MSGIQSFIAICFALAVSANVYTIDYEDLALDAIEELQHTEFLSNIEAPDALTVSTSSTQAPYEKYYYYQQLSDEEKRLYAALYEGAYLQYETFWLGTYENTDNVYHVFECVLADSPELFYVSPEGNYFAIDGRIQFKYSYYFDTDEIDTRITALNAVLQEVLERIPEQGSEQEKIRAIHDIVCERATYDDEAASEDVGIDDERYLRASDAYNALVEGSAICGGYAKAVAYLCHLADVPVIYATGYDIELGISQGGHAWNIVEVGGGFYVVDATFDDTLGGYTQPSHEYFLMPYEVYQEEVAPLDEYGPLP